MGLLTFKKGVHPPDMKKLSKDKKLVEIEAPKLLYFPVSQHIGAPAKPVVKKGDQVKVGQLIAEAGGFVSANIFSSVSGVVKGIEKRLSFLGTKVDTIIIENDGKYEKVEFKPLTEITPENIVNKIKEGGIVGLGGATFPTHVKLSPPEDKPIDTVVINGAECEPYLTSDYRLMMEFPEKIVEGLKLIMLALNAKKGFIGIENNKPDAYEKIKNLTDKEENIETVFLKTKYPQGGEKQLIYAVLKRKVPAGGLPMDVGVVVQNTGTAAAIYDLIKNGEPIYKRITTVTGRGINKPSNFIVPLGTPIQYLLEKAGGLKENAAKVIMGGPMMGFAISDLTIPVQKGTSGIVVLIEDEVYDKPYDVCIRCNKCIDVCPMNLAPYQYALLGERERYLEAKEWNVLDCIECGSCAFICPSKRPIVQFIKLEKAKVIAEMRSKK